MKFSTKFTLILSSLISAVFLTYSLYRGIILFFVNQAMEDTFIGGNASDISITLWFVIAGITFLITLMFLFFIKIKDLKSQKTILIGVTIFWFVISIFSIFISISILAITFVTFVMGVVCFVAIRNLKKEIIKELNKKGLSETEIHLLQRLAGLDKK